ncbi:MAG: hypothetical protein FWC19_05390 [Treponema sp.]|nr:hypothetical protein [Treponema sp.]MCL2272222.1 hypothetical protein [Treponema sp.]
MNIKAFSKLQFWKSLVCFCCGFYFKAVSKTGTVKPHKKSFIDKRIDPQTHAIKGERIIDKAIERTGDAEFLENAKVIAVFLHERWDGTGIC